MSSTRRSSKRARTDHESPPKELLEQADRVAEQQVVAPTPAERAAITSFCSLSLQCKKQEDATRSLVKDAKPAIKELRESLLHALKEEEEEVMLIPQAIRREVDARAAASGLPALPPYLRVMRNNKDLAITPDVINDAFASLSETDVLEADGDDGAQALVEAVLAAVRRNVRSFSEQVKLVDSVPRGVRAADVKLAADELARQAVALHENSSAVLHAERQKREALARALEEMATQKDAVDGYFVRGNMTHQPVLLENTRYNLCRRVTVIKPRVTFKTLAEVLHEGFKECMSPPLRGGGGGPLSKAAVAAALRSRRDDMQRLVVSRISAMPPSTRTVIHLQKVKSAAETL